MSYGMNVMRSSLIHMSDGLERNATERRKFSVGVAGEQGFYARIGN
jgi:hypothetical protein